MTYRLQLDQIKVGYRFVEESKFNVRITHSPGKKIRILPFKTTPPKDVYDRFKNTIGEFSRLASNKEALESFCPDELMSSVVDRVQTKQPSDGLKLRSILQTLLVDDYGELEVFHPVIFNYFSIERKKEQVQLAEFLYSVLWSNKLEEQFLYLYKEVPTNTLLRIVFEVLPKLSPIQKKQTSTFKNMMPDIAELFHNDMLFLMRHNQLFIENFERLIRYYYFFYVSQLALRLYRMFYAESEVLPLYFNLDWESTSRSRTSYDEGWRRLESAIKPLFSHVNTLEMLNYHGGDPNERYSYIELKKQFERLSEEEQLQVEGQIDTLINMYKEHVQDVDWGNFKVVSNPYTNRLEKKIFEFYRVIDFQFNESVRRKPYGDYQSWFTEYCKKFFLRKRGPMGYTLNMTEDNLMFITKLSMKDRNKIRLVNLFEEYEKRGFMFDRDSKDRIVILFEKLNLLEKKSDSGDAQYVKSIL